MEVTELDKGLQQEIDMYNRKIEIKESIEKLKETKEYKLVFDKVLFNEDTMRLTSLLATSFTRDPISKQRLVDDLYSISYMGNWFTTKIDEGNQAKDDLKDLYTESE